MQVPQLAPTQRANAQYGYAIEVPEQSQPEVTYKFDYEVEVPVIQSTADYLQGLYAHVDRVALQKPGMLRNRSYVIGNIHLSYNSHDFIGWIRMLMSMTSQL